MNKTIPIISVFLFWVLYYLGTTYEGIGEIIAIVLTLIIVLFLAYTIKGWLKRKASNTNINK